MVCNQRRTEAGASHFFGLCRLVAHHREKERTIFRFLRLFARPPRRDRGRRRMRRRPRINFSCPFYERIETLHQRFSFVPSPTLLSVAAFLPPPSDIRSDSIHSPFSLLRKSRAEPMERSRAVRRDDPSHDEVGKFDVRTDANCWILCKLRHSISFYLVFFP